MTTGSTLVSERLEQLLTSAEVAELFSVDERTLRRWRAEGRIKAIRIGRTVRFHPDDIEQVLRPHEATSAEEDQ